MDHRILGRTGLSVSVIGLGTEYLFHVGRDVVASVVGEAADAGVNFIDLLGAEPGYRDNFGATLRGRRDRFVLQGHLGGVYSNGQAYTTRELPICEGFLHDLLARLGTDYIDVINIQVVDRKDDYEQIMGAGGLLEVAQRFQSQGKARFLSLSTHTEDIALAAVESGQFDSIMTGLNMRWQQPKVTLACREQGIGLVAMKPFSGGEFFQAPYSDFITPVKALAYAIAQPGVSTVIPGVANADELRAALAYVAASPADREFESLLPDFEQRITGACVYCNHCLPCPAGISIGDLMWALRAKDRDSEYAEPAYLALGAKGSSCVECGDCMPRCPFGVDIVGQMRRAVRVFGA